MTKEEELMRKHPKILGKCFPGVGDGWLPIIDRLCTALQEDTDRDNTPQVVAVQIKEKFGGLRFYTDTACTKEQHALIKIAKDEADRTCEVCGAPGKARGGGWIQTLCDEHAKEDAE